MAETLPWNVLNSLQKFHGDMMNGVAMHTFFFCENMNLKNRKFLIENWNFENPQAFGSHTLVYFT